MMEGGATPHMHYISPVSGLVRRIGIMARDLIVERTEVMIRVIYRHIWEEIVRFRLMHTIRIAAEYAHSPRVEITKQFNRTRFKRSKVKCSANRI